MAADKKKVLHIFPEFKRGGAQVNVLRFIKGTQGKFVHYVAAAPYEDSLYKEYQTNTEDIFLIDMTGIKFSSIVKLISVIKTLKPDIIHVNGKGGALYGFISSFFVKKTFKMYHTMRGFHIKFTGVKRFLYLLFENLSARRMDGNIMVSPSEMKFLSDNIPSIPREKLILIPNGIEVHDTPLPQNIHEVIKQYKINIVTLSRLSPQKDLISMIDAFDNLARKNEEVVLHVMGGETPQDKEYADIVKEKIGNSPVKERIFLWGSIKDAGSLIQYFQIYWSTALFEGLPTAVVEAALNRVLIVGTDCVGNRDLIIPEKTGILTKVQDSETITRGIEKSVEIYDKKEGAQFIEQAYILCSQYSVENNCKSLISLYKKDKMK